MNPRAHWSPPHLPRLPRPDPVPNAERHADGIDWDVIPLGLYTDEAIGDRLGVNKWVVAHARRLRGIRSYREVRRAAWRVRGPVLDLEAIAREVEEDEASGVLPFHALWFVSPTVPTRAGLTMLWPDACDPRSESAFDWARSGVFPMAQRPEGDRWTTCGW